MTTVSIIKMTEDEGTIIDITPVRESSDWKNEFAKWLIGNRPRCGQIARVERDNGDGMMDVIATYNPRQWQTTAWIEGDEYGVVNEAYLSYMGSPYDDCLTYRMDLVDITGTEKKVWYAFDKEQYDDVPEDELPFNDEHIVRMEVI